MKLISNLSVFACKTGAAKKVSRKPVDALCASTESKRLAVSDVSDLDKIILSYVLPFSELKGECLGFIEFYCA